MFSLLSMILIKIELNALILKLKKSIKTSYIIFNFYFLIIKSKKIF